MSTATKSRQKKTSKTPAKSKVVEKPAPRPRKKPVVQEPEPVEHVSMTERRYQIQDAVQAGATIGSIVEEFGKSALRTIARHTRFARFAIAGIKPDSPAHLDPVADAQLAERLSKLRPATPIKLITMPPRRA